MFRNLRIALSTLLIASTAFIGSATEPASKAKSAHKNAHTELLANQKNRIDKNTVADFVESSIKAREHSEELPGLSPESAMIVNDLLKEGNKHLGKRYVWGSKGPNTFDCSGFTSYVYKQFGYNLSPASKTQYTQGVSVKRNELRKGDLVFFTSPRSGRSVGHVGMVVSAEPDGNFKFIHASSKGVRVSDINEGYYNARYIGARRVITE